MERNRIKKISKKGIGLNVTDKLLQRLTEDVDELGATKMGKVRPNLPLYKKFTQLS